MTLRLGHQKTVQIELECARDCCKVDIHVNSPLSSSLFGSRFGTVRLGQHTPSVLIPTYSYYFLTQFGSFLFIRVKY